MQYPIGGFFPLELPGNANDSCVANGLLFAWTGGYPFSAFANARSALFALVSQLEPKHVWLPSFVCTAVAEGVPRGLQRFYAIDDTLTADVETLAQATAGDIVLGVNYFGCGPDERFLNFVATRPDLLFVEDCAHCAVPEQAWGHWRLFSPRKVVGVADGGILVNIRPDTILPKPSDMPVDANALWSAPLQRFESPLQEGSTQWHPANQAKEAAMQISGKGATRLSLALLNILDPKEIARRRRDNFATLQTTLGEHQLPLRATIDNVPFTFPVRLTPQQRNKVLHQLHANGIFAAVHWENLPVTQADFPQAYQLSQSLISLPCDQRYKTEHMEYLASIFLRALA